MSDLRAGIRKPNIWMSLVHVTFVIREYAVLAFLFYFITFTFLLIFALVSLPLPLVITLDHAQRQASLAKNPPWEKWIGLCKWQRLGQWR